VLALPVGPAEVRNPVGAVGIVDNLDPEAVEAAIKVAAVVTGGKGEAGVEGKWVTVGRLERDPESVGGHVLIVRLPWRARHRVAPFR